MTLSSTGSHRSIRDKRVVFSFNWVCGGFVSLDATVFPGIAYPFSIKISIAQIEYRSNR